jgi:hypothetical protein
MTRPQTLGPHTRKEPIMSLGTASTMLLVAVFASTVRALWLVPAGGEHIGT